MARQDKRIKKRTQKKGNSIIMKYFLNLLAAALLLFTATPAIFAADGETASLQVEKSKALEISEKNQDALVMVRFVVTLHVKLGSNESQPTDQQLQNKGVVVRKDGLVVLANSQTDPTQRIRQQLQRRAGNQPVEVNTTVKEVKIIMNDGSEIEAEVAIKDADIDLTLVRPKEALDKDMTAVTLEPQSSPGILDPVIAMTRMGLDAGRAVLLVRDHVRGIIEKPRKYYVLQSVEVGVPVFDAQGRCFGIYLGRSNASGTPVGTIFVLPAADILDVINQIPS
jgi:S1-C subfamily serine protease